jgi:predicted metal-binding protein
LIFLEGSSKVIYSKLGSVAFGRCTAVRSRKGGNRVEVARIPVRRDRSRVQKDLKELCTKATELGARDARILNARDIAAARLTGREKRYVVTDEEKSIHWPDPLYPNDDIVGAIAHYQWAILFRVDIDQGATGEQRRPVPGSARWQASEKVFRIAASIESQCFYKGYHLALGLADSNCRDVYCHEERRCWAMIKGRACIHPYKARPPLEVCGLDPLALVQKAGWAKFPGAGSGTFVQPGFVVGLVLVL